MSILIPFRINQTEVKKNEFQKPLTELSFNKNIKCSIKSERSEKKNSQNLFYGITRLMAERQMFCHTYSRYSFMNCCVSDYEIIPGNALWPTLMISYIYVMEAKVRFCLLHTEAENKQSHRCLASSCALM